MYEIIYQKDPQTGKTVKVKGKLDTIMAGLACGEPNVIGWDILRNHAAGCAAIGDRLGPDDLAA